MKTKPLSKRAYGSIPHLPNSRLGPADHCVHDGQAAICTVKPRDKKDVVIVQEKLDGSCVAVAKIDGVLHALGRAGYPAASSRFEQHRLFDQWVWRNQERFHAVLHEGERIVGEWLSQAHGTIYDLGDDLEPFVAFDIMLGDYRLSHSRFMERIAGAFDSPTLLHYGQPISVEAAMKIHATKHRRCDEPEGVVYRVERDGEVDFLAKWVRPDKQDGKYLPEVSGREAVWNWRPNDG